MATYKWSIASGNQITGTTYIKDTDNKIQSVMDDLVDFVNSEGDYAGQGLMFDYVDKASNQTIPGVKTFSNGIVSNITGNATGNSGTTTKLQTSKNITLAGAISGTVSTDLSSDVIINTTSNIVTFISGMIMMWAGSSASIPSGWLLCNGLNGTPNLTDRFVIGAGGSYGAGVTGGYKDATLPLHVHTFSGTTSTGGSHNHTVTGNYDGVNVSTISSFGGGSAYTRTANTSTNGDHSHTYSGTTTMTGNSATNMNLPPYYALCFIMKA